MLEPSQPRAQPEPESTPQQLLARESFPPSFRPYPELEERVNDTIYENLRPEQRAVYDTLVKANIQAESGDTTLLRSVEQSLSDMIGRDGILSFNHRDLRAEVDERYPAIRGGSTMIVSIDVTKDHLENVQAVQTQLSPEALQHATLLNSVHPLPHEDSLESWKKEQVASYRDNFDLMARELEQSLDTIEQGGFRDRGVINISMSLTIQTGVEATFVNLNSGEFPTLCTELIGAPTAAEATQEDALQLVVQVSNVFNEAEQEIRGRWNAALDRAERLGIPVVIGSGNAQEGPFPNNTEAQNNLLISRPSVIAAGASSNNLIPAAPHLGGVATFSSPNSIVMPLLAQGEYVRVSNGTYESGTSFSTPAIAATAALLQDLAANHNQTFSPTEIRALLTISATRISPESLADGQDPSQFGDRVLNPTAALRLAEHYLRDRIIRTDVPLAPATPRAVTWAVNEA